MVYNVLYSYLTCPEIIHFIPSSFHTALYSGITSSVLYHRPFLLLLLITFYLFMEVEFVQLGEHPAHAAVSSAHQDAKRHKLLEETQAGEDRVGRKLTLKRTPIAFLLQRIRRVRRSSRVPELWSSIHQVEHLSRVEKLLELAQELHALVVPAFGVHEDQERAGAGRSGGLPEA